MTDLNSPYQWFDNATTALARAYQQNRLPHGLIIAAPEGSGKMEFAQFLVASLLCSVSKQSLAEPCGQCKSCQLLKAQTHPDFYFLQRLSDSKGKQKSSIGIDQIRELTAKLADMAQLGGWRIALVSSVSDLTTASFNALLKTLEEPGKQTLLLLIASNLQTLPATIKSRCQIVQPEFATTPLIKWLETQNELQQNTKENIIRALESCFNAPLKARDYLKNNLAKIHDQLYQNCDQLLSNQITPSQLIEQSKLTEEEILALLPAYFYQLEKSLLTGTGNTLYRQLPKKLPFQLYLKMLEYNRAKLAGSHLQANLQLQEILIQWFEIGRLISLKTS